MSNSTVSSGEQKFTAVVEDAHMKSDAEKLMLLLVLSVFIGTTEQKIYETMLIDHPNLQAMIIGRRKAKALSVACGYERRPEDVSELIGKKLQVTLELDYDGEFKIKKYEKLEEELPNAESEDVLF